MKAIPASKMGEREPRDTRSNARQNVKSVKEGGNDEALDALMALGFSLKEATAALEKVDPKLSLEEKIKMALKK